MEALESSDRGWEVGQLGVAEIENGEIRHCPELKERGERGREREEERVLSE